MRGERGEDGVSVGEIGQKVGFAGDHNLAKSPLDAQGKGRAWR